MTVYAVYDNGSITYTSVQPVSGTYSIIQEFVDAGNETVYGSMVCSGVNFGIGHVQTFGNTFQNLYMFDYYSSGSAMNMAGVIGGITASIPGYYKVDGNISANSQNSFNMQYEMCFAKNNIPEQSFILRSTFTTGTIGDAISSMRSVELSGIIYMEAGDILNLFGRGVSGGTLSFKHAYLTAYKI